MDNVKVYTRRDSCTAALKKMGVGKENYNLFIHPIADHFQLDVEGASAFVAGKWDVLVAIRKAAEEAKAKPAKTKSKTVKADTGKRESVSAACQRLIREGKSNNEVWLIIKAEFNLDDKKKYYPAWNRSMMARKGEDVGSGASNNDEVL